MVVLEGRTLPLVIENLVTLKLRCADAKAYPVIIIWRSRQEVNGCTLRVNAACLGARDLVCLELPKSVEVEEILRAIPMAIPVYLPCQ